VQAQDRLRDASGTCDGVGRVDRCGKVYAEGERLGIHMLVGDHVIVPQHLNGRVCHVVTPDEGHIKRARERGLVGHRGMLISDTRLRAIHGYAREELIDQAAGPGRGESLDNALHQGGNRQGRRVGICMAQTDAYEEQANFPGAVISGRGGLDLMDAMDGVT